MVYQGIKRGFQALIAVGVILFIAFFSWTTIDFYIYLRESVKRASNFSTTQYAHQFASGKTSNFPFPRYEAFTKNTLHHIYPVNCSAVFANERKEILRIDRMLNEEKNKSSRLELKVPSDDTVADYASDCELYREARDYPTQVLSDEEKNFPLAFIILTHKNAAQFEMLLRAIYQPHNVYAIHPDKKSSPKFHRAIANLARCFDNVFICSKLESIQYAGYTRLLADINCMRDLVRHPIQWRYLMNQCGEAFPLKTNLEMVQQIKAYHGINDVEGYIDPHKINRFHKFSPKHQLFNSSSERLRRFPPPGNITLLSGNAYNTFSREFIEYTLNDPLPVQFLAWINATYSPDEHFWASMQRAPGAPGGYKNTTISEINTIFVKWGGGKSPAACIGTYIRGICVIATGYLPFVARRPHLFANKFHYSRDPVTLQCLQELLTNRTRDPLLRNQYFTEFPIKRSWYNKTYTYMISVRSS